MPHNDSRRIAARLERTDALAERLAQAEGAVVVLLHVPRALGVVRAVKRDGRIEERLVDADGGGSAAFPCYARDIGSLRDEWCRERKRKDKGANSHWSLTESAFNRG